MLIPLDFHIMATQPSQLSKLTRKACWIVRDLRGNAPHPAVEGGSMVGPGGVKHVLPGWSRLSYLYLSIYPSIHLFIYPSNHLSIYPSNHLSIHPSIHPSIYLCVCRAITGLRWSWWHSIVSLANCFTQVLLLSLYMSISIIYIYMYVHYLYIRTVYICIDVQHSVHARDRDPWHHWTHIQIHSG